MCIAFQVYIIGLRCDLNLPAMDWDGIPQLDNGGIVRSVLDTDDKAVEEAELTEAQWTTVQMALASQSIHARTIHLDSKIPTLTSSYHHAGNFTTRFVFEDSNGSPRDGVTGRRPRFLTPRECARCMGFPDSFVIPDEHTERGRGAFYHQIGNAVCPPVIQAIGQQLLKSVLTAP